MCSYNEVLSIHSLAEDSTGCCNIKNTYGTDKVKSGKITVGIDWVIETYQGHIV